MKQNLVIADYGCGNIQSLINAFDAVGAHAELVDNPDALDRADKVVLPGVGAFSQAMEKLNNRGFSEALDVVRKRGKIILGICLGMQLMCRGSDEDGDHTGLGWLEADVQHFASHPEWLSVEPRLKVPHMGWNEIHFDASQSLFNGIKDGADVYFVHSHAVRCDKEENILCRTDYGVEFVSGIHHENIFGMQFHPEKSHRVGLKILENFVGM